jgi:copper transport protein
MTDLLTALMFTARLIQTIALLILLGGTIFLAVVRWPNSDGTRQGRWLEHRAHRYLWGGWGGALFGSLMGLVVWGPWSRGEGVARLWSVDAMLTTLQARFGLATMLRIALLLAVAPLLWAGWPWPGGRRRTAGHRRPGWLIAAGLLLTPPLGGHAGGGPDPIYGAILGWIHLSAAAVWGGGLMLLLVCVLPRSRLRLRNYVPQFSAMATVSISVATITGSIQSWRQLHSVQALWTTHYGWFLLAKLLAFGLLMMVAAGSHYLTKQAAQEPEQVPTLPGIGGQRRAVAVLERQRQRQQEDRRAAWLLRRFVVAEILVAIFVLGATELMANTQPGYVEAEERQASENGQLPLPTGPLAPPAGDELLPGELGAIGDVAKQADDPDPAGPGNGQDGSAVLNEQGSVQQGSSP